MAVTFGHDGLIVPKALAADALTQLNLMSIFSKASSGGFDKNGAFQYGATVNFRRVQILEAEDYDPRGGTSARSDDPGYVTGDLILNHLFTTGVPRRSSDYQNDKYIEDVSPQLAFAITKKFDNALYDTFRTPTHASSGAVAYSVGMPLRVVVAEDATTGALKPFENDLLINAGASLEEEDVPPGDLYAVLATRAKSAYLGEQIPFDAGSAWSSVGIQNLISKGFPIGQFLPRMGFMVGGSNVIKKGAQLAVADLDTAASSQASLAIASVAANTDFTKGDVYTISGGTATSLGAVNITVTATALQNVAVGQIARLGPDSGKSKAYGIVLRVVGLVVTLVPFAPNGEQLDVSDIVAGTDKFSIPKLPSVNIAYKKQALIYDTRQLEAPPDGAGARMAGARDEQSGLMLQYWEGTYDVDTFKSKTRVSMLSGVKFTDYRMGCFMLSA